jgi:hypothetical protein
MVTVVPIGPLAGVKLVIVGNVLGIRFSKIINASVVPLAVKRRSGLESKFISAMLNESGPRVKGKFTPVAKEIVPGVLVF